MSEVKFQLCIFDQSPKGVMHIWFRVDTSNGSRDRGGDKVAPQGWGNFDILKIRKNGIFRFMLRFSL